MPQLLIKGGTVYDPKNEIDGEVRDIWIQDGRIIDAPSDVSTKADKTIDATGYVIMPGGVDMHCHIAGPKVNTARKMMPDDKRLAPMVHRTMHTRSGTTGAVPSTWATGSSPLMVSAGGGISPSFTTSKCA